jgi:hypothetical protein
LEICCGEAAVAAIAAANSATGTKVFVLLNVMRIDLLFDFEHHCLLPNDLFSSQAPSQFPSDRQYSFR